MAQELKHDFLKLHHAMMHTVMLPSVKAAHPSLSHDLHEVAGLLLRLDHLRKGMLASDASDGAASDEMAASIMALLGIEAGS